MVRRPVKARPRLERVSRNKGGTRISSLYSHIGYSRIFIFRRGIYEFRRMKVQFDAISGRCVLASLEEVKQT